VQFQDVKIFLRMWITITVVVLESGLAANVFVA
jgi:hypothetical protein